MDKCRIMKKVIVIGCPGAGKSTFSRGLHRKTGLPLFYLDMLFWNKDRSTCSREVFDERLREIMEGECWILDGNYSRTLAMRLQECDTVFLLDLPVETCLQGAASRIGKVREDLPWVEQELDGEFRQWIVDFPQNELPYIRALLQKYAHKNIVVFHSHEQMDDYLFCLKADEGM